MTNIGLSRLQNSTLNILFEILYDWDTDIGIAANRPTPDLLAEKKQIGNIQYPLPPNKWQIEVLDWHASSLATI
jgi:hypothetical protein